MKVAFLGLRGLTNTYGGIERHVEHIALNLARKGHKVTVYCMKGYAPKEQIWRGIRIVTVPRIKSKHFEMLLYGLFVVFDVVLYRDYDILHCHSVELSFLLMSVRILRPRCTIFVTSHGPAYRRVDKWNRVARLLLRIAEKGFAIVPHERIVIAKFLQSFYGLAYQKIFHFVPNGVIVDNPSSDWFIKKNKLDKERYILYVGRLIPSKGCHILIEAFNRANLPIKLAIAGEGIYNDNYVKSLFSMSNNEIIFLGNVVGDSLWQLYRNALFLVFPSAVESLPMVMLEAFAFGLPVIYCDVPENRSIANSIGIPFKRGDVFDLVEKIRWAYNHPAKLKRLGVKAQQLVKTQYDWDNVTKKIETLYLKYSRHNPV